MYRFPQVPRWLPTMTGAMFGSSGAEQFASLVGARRAWFAADFDRCIVLCIEAEGGDDADAVLEARVLRVRALLRLGRAPEALASLDAFGTGGPRSGELQVLRGTALIRAGESEPGVRHLNAVLDGDPSPEIAGEALLGIALHAFNARHFETAERTLGAVTVEDGPIGARVAEFRGWIAYYSYRLADAVDHFVKALERNAAATEPEPWLGANAVCTLAYIAKESMDAGLWAEAERWAARVPGLQTPGSILAHRFAYERSVWLEVTGRAADALSAAREAETFAPTEALRLVARCRRAAILFRYGERLAYDDVAATIRDAFDSLDLDATVASEEAQLAREVAEVLALLGDVDGARAALERSAAARVPSAQEGDPQIAAIEAYVLGALADAAGETLRARHAYERAFNAFKALGLVRRATMTALLLADLTDDADVYAYASEIARKLPPASWIRARMIRIEDTRRDPVVAALTRAQREVVTMLAAGKSTAEIAAARGRSLQTTRNTISTLLRTFGAQNRQMLVREYLLRATPPASDDSTRTRGA
jgi:DNA-binding CsgD family transcriptional regulator